MRRCWSPAEGPAGTVDLMLAAIARVGRVRIATSPSEPVGLTLIDPWKGVDSGDHSKR